jgi:hypothetical protein
MVRDQDKPKAAWKRLRRNAHTLQDADESAQVRASPWPQVR